MALSSSSWAECGQQSDPVGMTSSTGIAGSSLGAFSSRELKAGHTWRASTSPGIYLKANQEGDGVEIIFSNGLLFSQPFSPATESVSQTTGEVLHHPMAAGNGSRLLLYFPLQLENLSQSSANQEVQVVKGACN